MANTINNQWSVHYVGIKQSMADSQDIQRDIGGGGLASQDVF